MEELELLLKFIRVDEDEARSTLQARRPRAQPIRTSTAGARAPQTCLVREQWCSPLSAALCSPRPNSLENNCPPTPPSPCSVCSSLNTIMHQRAGSRCWLCCAALARCGPFSLASTVGAQFNRIDACQHRDQTTCIATERGREFVESSVCVWECVDDSEKGAWRIARSCSLLLGRLLALLHRPLHSS